MGEVGRRIKKLLLEAERRRNRIAIVKAKGKKRRTQVNCSPLGTSAE
jgi:Mg-chelatase subunit ChlD